VLLGDASDALEAVELHNATQEVEYTVDVDERFQKPKEITTEMLEEIKTKEEQNEFCFI